MRKKIELSYDPNGLRGGKLGCYRARAAEHRGVHAAGATLAEAVGDLMVHHPKIFGKKVDAKAAPQADPALMPLDATPEGILALGNLALEHPDVFGIEISLRGTQYWPQSAVKANVYDIAS